MKVIFHTGVEAPISKVSSKFCLTLPTDDKTEIANFQALLTRENLKSFKIVNDEGETTEEAVNMVFQSFDQYDGRPEGYDRVDANFLLRPLSEMELKLFSLEEEKELQAEAITELASIMSDV